MYTYFGAFFRQNLSTPFLKNKTANHLTFTSIEWSPKIVCNDERDEWRRQVYGGILDFQLDFTILQVHWVWLITSNLIRKKLATSKKNDTRGNQIF